MKRIYTTQIRNDEPDKKLPYESDYESILATRQYFADRMQERIDEHPYLILMEEKPWKKK